MTLISIAGLLMGKRLASTAVLLQLERLFFIAFALLLLARVASTEHVMLCSMPCVLEIKNGGFKLDHVVSCHSSNKNIITLLTQCL